MGQTNTGTSDTTGIMTRPPGQESARIGHRPVRPDTSIPRVREKVQRGTLSKVQESDSHIRSEAEILSSFPRVRPERKKKVNPIYQGGKNTIAHRNHPATKGGLSLDEHCPPPDPEPSGNLRRLETLDQEFGSPLEDTPRPGETRPCPQVSAQASVQGVLQRGDCFVRLQRRHRRLRHPSSVSASLEQRREDGEKGIRPAAAP